VPCLGRIVNHGAPEVVADANEAIASAFRRSAFEVLDKAEVPVVSEHG
jgi:hypothetical protein